MGVAAYLTYFLSKPKRAQMERHILRPVGQRIVMLILFGIILSCSFGRTNWAEQTAPDIPKTQQQDDNRDTESHQTEFSDTQLALVNQVFASRLLEVASEYKQFGRVDQKMRWSPTLCTVPPQPPKNLGSMSASESLETHGKKLYYLYARKPWQYQSNVWGFGADSGPIRAPLGQVLVKEAWHPVKVDGSRTVQPKLDGADRVSDSAPKVSKRPYAVSGKQRYQAGKKKGLYIMFKTLETTPGTDRGWVYGTVSADGKKVTSVGMVQNCMECHHDAPHDRQIGLPIVDVTGVITP